MIMNVHERYDKIIMEEFAIRTISKSYDMKYATYFTPQNTDNFDFLSKDMMCGLEVTTVITDNEQAAYQFEREMNKGKSPDHKRIKNAELRDDGTLSLYYSGTIGKLKNKIAEAIKKKHKKALRRIANAEVKFADLCVCIADGGLLDLSFFEQAFKELEEYIFANIFFVTSSHFVRYNKDSGFQEYERRF